MRHLFCSLGLLLAAFVTTAARAAERPLVGPAPDWVQPAGADTPAAAPSEAALLVLLSDQQINLSPKAVESYSESRIRIQAPQGLAALGTLALSWRPDSDVLTVHRLVVRRGSQLRDLLGSGDGFTILRREDQLEQAVLTGALTAVLQPSDLQVGDIIELAYTLRHADPVVPDLPDRDFAWPNARIQQARFSARWPKEMPVRWQLRDFKPALQEATDATHRSVAFTLDNAEPLLQPTGAPARFAAVRRAELTAFESWPQVSQRMAPLYAKAAMLAPTSPLRAEVERIRNAHKSPQDRAAAALQLVQEQVRYVLLAMNDGGLTPATADQTWERRYGDCKAKTALLLALLRELGIEAQPVVVNTDLGDDLDRHLPAVGAFNHVLARVDLGGKTYWLDGTRLGDRRLDAIPVPYFGWGLPLLSRGSGLVKIQPPPFAEPQTVHDIRIDASNGVDEPARVSAKAVFRGDDALALQQALDNQDSARRDQRMREYWRGLLDRIDIAKVQTSHDDSTGEVTWSAEGTLRMDWSKDNWFELENLRLGYRADLTRPAGTDANAPYALSYPEYRVSRYSITLPPQKSPFTIYGDNIDQTIAGTQYKRKAGIENSVFTAEASFRTLAPEFPASEARAAEAALRAMYKNALFIGKPDGYLPTVKEFVAQAGTPLKTADEYFTRGVGMMTRALPGLAIAEFTAAIKLDPESAQTFANRGVAYIGMSQLREARADLEQALALQPGYAFALFNLGFVEAGEGHFREAIDVLTKALEKEDSNAARRQIAVAYLQLGELDRALSELESYSRKNPNERSAYMDRAMVLLKLGRETEVSALVKEALAAKAGPGEGAALASELYRMLGESDRADKLLDEAIRKAPSADLYVLRAQNQPDPSAARASLQQALKLDPRHVTALTGLAVTNLKLKDFQGALQAIDQLESAYDTLPGFLESIRSEALTGLGDAAGASRTYAALRAKATNGLELNSLCWAKASRNLQLEEALKDCDAALALLPDCSACHDSRGLVLLRLKRFDEAMASYDTALSSRPEQAMSLFGRGIAKLRLGRNAEGEADIAAAMKFSPKVAEQFQKYGITR